MFQLNALTGKILKEFAGCKKPIGIHTEGNLLIIRCGTAETRLVNWQNMTEQEIIDMTRSFVLSEKATNGKVLLNE